MEYGENGRTCRSYLEEMLGDDMKVNKIVCWPSKNRLIISDIDLFHI